MNIPVIAVAGQYNHLIARALTELGVKSELLSMNTSLEELQARKPDAVMMGGGPQAVHEDLGREKLGNLPGLIKGLDVPLLCICVTHQLLAVVYGGKTGKAKRPEFGPISVLVDAEDELLEGTSPSFKAWASHNDEVVRVPDDFQVLAHSKNCSVHTIRHKTKPVFGVQFHPEVYHTEKGKIIFQNFAKLSRRI